MKIPSCCTKLRQVDDELGERGQVGAEALEQRLELRDHEDQQNDRDDDRDDQHGGRVEQRLLDLLLQRLGLFLVGRDLVQQGSRARRPARRPRPDSRTDRRSTADAWRGPRAATCRPRHRLLMSRISFCIAGLSLPLATISNACTSGMPAASMVASWRLKIAMSPGLTLPPLRALALLADLATARRPGGAARRAASARRARGSCP